MYRNIAVGSEPLYDWALEPWALANEINSLKAKMAPYGIKISESSFAFSPFLHPRATTDAFSLSLPPFRLSSSADLKRAATSEMPYGYQIHNNAPAVAQAIDFVEGESLVAFAELRTAR